MQLLLKNSLGKTWTYPLIPLVNQLKKNNLYEYTTLTVRTNNNK